MKKATMKFAQAPGEWRGHAAVYALDPPMDCSWGQPIHHVIVSAANVLFSGPETYIFAADVNGKVLDWRELDGSFQGGTNHREALERAGYSLD